MKRSRQDWEVQREKELETFRLAMEDYIRPVAEHSGLSFIKIDEKLYALVASSFSFKFYCAGGHGYSFTVTVAPTYTPTWNAKDEWGFPWLAKYIGKHSWIHERYGNLGAFSQGFADLAGILPEYFEVLNKPKPAFWDSFNGFVANEIARNQKSK